MLRPIAKKTITSDDDDPGGHALGRHLVEPGRGAHQFGPGAGRSPAELRPASRPSGEHGSRTPAPRTRGYSATPGIAARREHARPPRVPRAATRFVTRTGVGT